MAHKWVDIEKSGEHFELLLIEYGWSEKIEAIREEFGKTG
jgi:hypothetical protein